MWELDCGLFVAFNEHIDEDDGATAGKELKLAENIHHDGAQVATPMEVS